MTPPNNPLAGLSIEADFDCGHVTGYTLRDAAGKFFAGTLDRISAEAIREAGTLRVLGCGHPVVCRGKVRESDEPHCLWCGDIADLSTVCNNLGLVYEHVTGGKVSKPLTDPAVVIAMADDCTTKAVEEYVKDETQEIRDRVHAVADQIWQGLLDQRQASDALYEISGGKNF